MREDAQILQVIGKASAQAYAAETIVLRTAEALDAAYFNHFEGDENADLRANDRAELESSQGQVVISELVLKPHNRII